MFDFEDELFRVRKETVELRGACGTLRIWYTSQCCLYCGDNCNCWSSGVSYAGRGTDLSEGTSESRKWLNTLGKNWCHRIHNRMSEKQSLAAPNYLENKCWISNVRANNLEN